MTELCIALIGGIGSGKSTAANYFYDMGVHVINTDKIAKQLCEKEEIKLQIKNCFGNSLFDKNNHLKRPLLAKIVFSDASKKKQLENIIHPRVRDEILREIKQPTFPYCLIEIPVFLKREEHPYVQKVLCITSNKSLQIKHTKARDKRSEKEIEEIINQQLTDVDRQKLADDIIFNTGTLDDLKKQCSALHEKYITLSKSYS
jgi:dephospho-CoA kinase